MHTFIMINALICINNYVITCINSMLSVDKPGFTRVQGERRQERPVAVLPLPGAAHYQVLRLLNVNDVRLHAPAVVVWSFNSFQRGKPQLGKDDGSPYRQSSKQEEQELGSFHRQ